ncbi:AAA family ATPase [Listeria booriae]|nr:hypothetical protein [Listeria booriae]
MMKNIKLLELELKNFKGVRDFKLVTNGNNVDVFGKNGTGKTSVFDAFTWLLFDKDSKNKKDAGIKTIENEEELHGLEHSVMALLSIDGEELRLKKIYTEKYTMKRGTTDQEFNGHETSYEINEVPTSRKKDFVDRVASIIDETTFKMLTNPLYFNENLKWQERRQILLDIAGDVDDNDVVDSNAKLAGLLDILGSHSVEEKRKQISAQKSKINDNLKMLPGLINEVDRGKPDLSALDKKDISSEIAFLTQEKNKKESQLADVRNGGLISELRNKKLTIENELMELDNKTRSANYELISEKQNEVSQQKIAVSSVSNIVDMAKSQLKIDQNQHEKLEKQKEEKIKEYFASVEQTFDEHRLTCPTCNQSFPEAQKEELIAKFNQEKAERSEKLMEEGKRLTNELDFVAESIESKTQELLEQEEELLNASALLVSLENELEKIKARQTNITDNVEYQELQKEIAVIEKQIESDNHSTTGREAEIQAEINKISEEIQKCQRDLMKFDLTISADARIEELRTDEKKYKQQYAELEKVDFMTEEFIRTKVSMLTEKINSKFKLARFKLFDTQINTGIKEICETIDNDGVLFNVSMNTGKKTIFGLDIIATLSEFYGVNAPVFLDNSESVTEPFDTDCQTIRLFARNEPELRVEEA